MTCLGSKVSVPTMDSLMSHLVLSLIWTPSLSVREYRSRSNLTYLVSEHRGGWLKLCIFYIDTLLVANISFSSVCFETHFDW